MEKMKHTPGPWKAKEEYEGWVVYRPERQIGTLYIAKEINQGKDGGESDAILIATAPNLLEALEELMRFEASLRMVMFNKLQAPEPFLKALDNAEATIKKARGL